MALIKELAELGFIAYILFVGPPAGIEKSHLKHCPGTESLWSEGESAFHLSDDSA